MTARRSTARFPAAQGWIPRGWNGVRSKRVWARLLGVEHTVIEDILFDEEADAIVACVRASLEAVAPRVRCPRHGVVVAALPWARHGAGSTQAFEDTVAWLVVHTTKTAVAELLRVAWRTVGV